jgi:hypothetical protein
MHLASDGRAQPDACLVGCARMMLLLIADGGTAGRPPDALRKAQPRSECLI